MKKSALAIAVFALTSIVHAQEGPNFDAVQFSSQDLGDGIHMLQGMGGNLGLSVGEDGTFLIDDDFAPLAEKAMAAIADITEVPVDYLVNTHWHGDHTGGNAAFHTHQNSRIIAHDNVRVRMAAPGNQQSPPEALPQLTYSENATLHYNGHTIDLIHVQQAHTDGDTIVRFQEANVIHTGDVMFHGLYPFIDTFSGGSSGGYIDALKLIHNLSDEQTKIIPGHGPLATKQNVADTIAFLTSARDKVKALVDQGMTLEQVIAADPLKEYHGAYAWAFIDGNRFTTILYGDLSGN